ncbi:hypothetical protein ACHAPQ_004031 [Fusarium lateritium]
MGQFSSDAVIALAGTVGTIVGLLVSCLAVWVAYQTLRRQGTSRNDVETWMIECIATQIGMTTPSYGLPFYEPQITIEPSFPSENLLQLPPAACQNSIGRVQRRTEVLAPPQPSSNTV